ncbi:hypothetical protein TNCV_2948911 [Trichonephila clavipes]|nr:hypothetical protein TNCV_2948911 [Trichonephila clavipes]
MTPELKFLSPNYHTTPTGGRLSSRQISRAWLPFASDLQRISGKKRCLQEALGFLQNLSSESSDAATDDSLDEFPVNNLLDLLSDSEED